MFTFCRLILVFEPSETWHLWIYSGLKYINQLYLVICGKLGLYEKILLWDRSVYSTRPKFEIFRKRERSRLTSSLVRGNYLTTGEPNTIHLGRVVRSRLTLTQGNVNWSIMFSFFFFKWFWLLMFGVVWDDNSSKLKGKQYKKNTTKKLQNSVKLKLSPRPELA